MNRGSRITNIFKQLTLLYQKIFRSFSYNKFKALSNDSYDGTTKLHIDLLETNVCLDMCIETSLLIKINSYKQLTSVTGIELLTT